MNIHIPSKEIESSRRESLRRMKRFATALLIGMAAVQAVSRYYRTRYAFLDPIVAFSEAAMVGALADWFAVVALFRHPLGLPIPHTAIIPKNKDRLGEQLAGFIRDNFLCQEALEARLNSVDVTGTIGRLFSDEKKAGELAARFVDYAAAVLERLGDEDLRGFRKELTARQIGQIDFGPWLGRILETVTEKGGHQLLLDGLLKTAARWLREHEDPLRLKLKEESPWWVPGMVDDKILEKLMTGLEEAVMQIRSDPGHPMRRKLDDAVHRLINSLEDSRDFEGRVKNIRERYFDHPAFGEFFRQLSSGMKEKILEDLRDPGSTIRKQVEQGIMTLGGELGENPAVREKMNLWICSSLLRLSSEYADSISSIVSETVRKWDAEKTSDRVEVYIGKDLQWIRINGTLVGGLVGLLIYLLGKLID
jgi:uncharacterized membrane-anchored protein YjiN (DUF445 family)